MRRLKEKNILSDELCIAETMIEWDSPRACISSAQPCRFPPRVPTAVSLLKRPPPPMVKFCLVDPKAVVLPHYRCFIELPLSLSDRHPLSNP
jgi:hypothetical protein